MFLWTSKDYTNVRLKENHVYRVQFSVNGEAKEFKFYTKFTPMYTTKKRVKMDFKNVLAQIPDTDIDLLTYENSKLALDMILTESENETVIGAIENNEPVPRIVEYYVRLKTQYDIIRDLLITIGMQAGTAEKGLGDFRITYEIKTPDLENILGALEDKIEKAEEALLGIPIAVNSFVRARDDEYPFSGRGLF